MSPRSETDRFALGTRIKDLLLPVSGDVPGSWTGSRGIIGVVWFDMVWNDSARRAVKFQRRVGLH